MIYNLNFVNLCEEHNKSEDYKGKKYRRSEEFCKFRVKLGYS